MKQPIIDEAKLPEVMKIIDEAVSLMEEKNCETDEAAKNKLTTLQKRLREIAENKKIMITDFQDYWGVTDLETVARGALMCPPEKDNLTNAQIKNIVLNILDHNEAEMDYWLAYLTVNTDLENLTDYIFYPNLVGLDRNATMEQIADKIIADRK